METKVIGISDKKIFEEDGKVYMTGYANTKGHPDSYGDIPTNFNGEDVYDLGRMKTNPVCFVDHYPSAANIAGNFVDLKEDDKGLFFKLLFRNMDTIHSERVKDAVSAYQTGFGRALSIGGEWLFEDRDNPAHLTKAVLHEISLVGIGADEQALSDTSYPKSRGKSVKTVVAFQDLPLADRDRSWDSAAAIGRVREWAGITENDDLEDPENQERYRQAFLWYDNEDQDLFGAYKLPIADVIDGTLTAVPRAVFAAAAVLRGARGGVFLPSNDRPGVIRHVERYYEKLGMESPFNGGRSFRIDEIEELEERVLEKLLTTGARFSRKNAKRIVAAIKSLPAGTAGDGHRDDELTKDDLKALNSKLDEILGGKDA